MRIALHVAPPMRSWHRALIEAIKQAGHEVGVELTPPEGSLTRSSDMVLAIERHVFGKRPRHFAAIDAMTGGGVADLHIILAGKLPGESQWLQPVFDGSPGEAALVECLLQGRAPVITVRDDAGRTLSAGLPAVEDRFVLSRALDGVLARLITLLVKAIVAVATPLPISVPEAEERTPNAASPALFIGRFLTHKLSGRFGAAKGRPDHWRIAYRRGASPPITERRAWPEGAFSTLQDDGKRFYADPFPFEHEGVQHLFFEDFPYDTSKGVISAVTIDPAGTASSPRVVLEQPVHLSYPFVFRDGEQIYMLPETSGAGCIRLFRADPFPDRWVPDRILVDGLIASDATLVQHGGLYWLFATITEPGGSTWDQLALFHSPTLFGPWTAHPLNPVLIDAGSARPAGAMWHEDGHLMRVAQDCRAGYGAGLAICRVDRLDPDGFAQTIVQRLGPPSGFGAAGVHTLNRCGDFEVIDLRVPHPR